MLQDRNVCVCVGAPKVKRRSTGTLGGMAPSRRMMPGKPVSALDSRVKTIERLPLYDRMTHEPPHIGGHAPSLTRRASLLGF